MNVGVDPLALEIAGLEKKFGGVHALRGVDLQLRRGEIHALLGENGSGKSTLIKVLAGYHAPDEGSLRLHGVEVPLPIPPWEVSKHALQFVHQDLGLVGSLSVTENMRIEQRAAPDDRWRIRWRREHQWARERLAEHGMDIDPRQAVKDLRPVEQAMVAIVRALASIRAGDDAGRERAPGVLVLDEPTVYLPSGEVDDLFVLLREIAAAGDSVMLVTHDLDEALTVADRISVLRDGRHVGTVDSESADVGSLIDRIVGHSQLKQDQRWSARSAPRESVALQVRDLGGGRIEKFDLDLHAGEIVGVTGLAGSGFEEIPYLLFGAQQADQGWLHAAGSQHQVALSKLNPLEALVMGLVLIPADRKADGAVLALSVTENLALPRLRKYFRGGRLRRREMRTGVGDLLEAFDVRPRDPTLEYGALSGGNQQKALLGKWLQTDPNVLLLHEPTQGVDVGAREQVFDVVTSAAANGMAVVCASTDHAQLAALCHRVLVVRRGVVKCELTGEQMTKSEIAARCYEGTATAGTSVDDARGDGQ